MPEAAMAAVHSQHAFVQCSPTCTAPGAFRLECLCQLLLVILTVTDCIYSVLIFGCKRAADNHFTDLISHSLQAKKQFQHHAQASLAAGFRNTDIKAALARSTWHFRTSHGPTVDVTAKAWLLHETLLQLQHLANHNQAQLCLC
jgi:hypothetical protein